jgi:hypothetical protein
VQRALSTNESHTIAMADCEIHPHTKDWEVRTKTVRLQSRGGTNSNMEAESTLRRAKTGTVTIACGIVETFTLILEN